MYGYLVAKTGRKSPEERSYAGDAVNHDHDRGAAVLCSGCTSRTVRRGETESGRVREAVLVDEGEHVKERARCFIKLSSRNMYEEVKEAQANHKQAQAELKMAEVEVDRIKRWWRKISSSPIRLEQAMAEADVARLQVQQAKSRLQRAETNFSYTTITAPFEGYVDRIPFKVGSLVYAEQLIDLLDGRIGYVRLFQDQREGVSGI